MAQTSLADDHRANLGRFADDDCVTEPLHGVAFVDKLLRLLPGAPVDLDTGVEGLDDVYVRRGDQPERGSGLIGSVAMLVRVVAFG